MEHKLRNGDWARNAAGLPVTLSGVPALLQLAENRLRIPRGSFLLDPGLGSRLYLVKEGCPGDPDLQAAQYAGEALEGLSGVEVLGARIVRREPFTVNVRLDVFGEEKTLEVTL